MQYDLSPLYKHSSSSSSFIPSTTLLVHYSNSRLIKRSSTSLDILRTWSLPLPATSSTTPTAILSISPLPPHLISVHFHSLSTAFIFNPDLDSLFAQFSFGLEACDSLKWSLANPLELLVWSAFHLRLSIYSVLHPQLPLVISNPKLSPLLSNYSYGFRPHDAKYLAVLERHNGRDSVGIYESLPSTKLIRHFNVLPPTSTTTPKPQQLQPDIAGLLWSPCGRYLALWESSTTYKLYIFTPDGRCLKEFDRVEQKDGLGVKMVSWHPSGEWIAIGGADGKIKVLSRLGWVVIATFETNSKISNLPFNKIFLEPTGWIAKTRGKGIISFENPPQGLGSSVYNLPSTSNSHKDREKFGITILEWGGKDSGVLASYNPQHPKTIFIHRLLSPAPNFSLQPKLISVIILEEPLPFFGGGGGGILSWNDETLIISTGRKSFLTWKEEEGVEGIGIPAKTEFSTNLITVSPDGGCLLLADRDLFAVAYPVVEDEGVGEERSWEEGGGRGEVI